MNDKELVQLKNIDMVFFNQDGVLPVLEDIHFTLHQGEIAALLGPSGYKKLEL